MVVSGTLPCVPGCWDWLQREWSLLLVLSSHLKGLTRYQYTTGKALLPWWSILLFTVISFFIAVCLGFSGSHHLSYVIAAF